MALISVRNFLKCGASLTDLIIFNSRSIVVSSSRNSTGAPSESKAETSSRSSREEEKSETNLEIESLNKQITELTSQKDEYLDKYKRALADGENLRSRLTKQISEAKIYGIQSFCKDLLDVADVLSRANETVPKEELEKNSHLKSLYEGLTMTEAQLLSVFKRHGLEQVNPIDEKFNPNFHEALFTQDVQGKESGTVVIVSKIGYKLHERVIRPALVGVAK